MTGTQVERCPNPRCHEPVHAGDSFCEACGQPLDANAEPDPAPNGAVAARNGSRADPREHLEIAYVDLAGVSDRGFRRRRNEDAIALARVEEHDARVLVVCDGVSTSAAPDR